MSTITLCDLEVQYRIGVPDEERAQPQRLLLTLMLAVDFQKCTVTDDVRDTVNYFEVAQLLLHFGKRRTWKTLEKLASDIADAVLETFEVRAVTVEVKKFIIPETRYVSVSLSRQR